MGKKISFVIPCYGSEQTLPAVVGEIREAMSQAAMDGKHTDYEIILINDNSPDGVVDVIRSLANGDPSIIGIDLARNFGQHAALMAGFQYVSGDYIACLDDDGQTPASQVFRLIDKLDEGYDAVYARYYEKKHAWYRNIGSRLNEIMARVMLGKPKALSIMSYFACKRFIIDEIVKYKNPYPYIGGLLLRSSANIANVPVDHRDRLAGKSGYSIRKLLSLWINGFTSFSVKPLRIASVFGCVVAGIGFIYGLYIIINKLINPMTPLGYSSTMAVLLFIGGVIMLILGMIGEYIGRIYISINNSPQYVIRETWNAPSKPTGGRSE